MSRKNIWTFVVFFATFVLVSNYSVDVPCEQCGGKCIEECFMARVACNFQRNFLHFKCLPQYCIDNPIRLNSEGKIIRRD